MLDKQKFFESMEIIDTVVQNIQRSKVDAKKLNLQAGTAIAGDVMFLNYIKICIVLEELKKLNSLCKDDEQLREIFICISPLYKYARKYEEGFFAVRNTLVAHYNRDKSGKYVSFFERLGTLNVPRANAELEYIYDCLECIRYILFINHPEVSDFVNETVTKSFSHIVEFDSKFVPKSPLHIDDLKKEVDNVLKEKGFLGF